MGKGQIIPVAILPVPAVCVVHAFLRICLMTGMVTVVHVHHHRVFLIQVVQNSGNKQGQDIKDSRVVE